ncbi:MAG: hypothetical protein GY943_11290, partial [Chloroflexi bacterium]|nr:hypothetical protein [Chloroflexota bacterium]
MSNKSLKFQYRIIVLLFSFGLFAILQANLPEQALIQAAPSPQDEILQAWELAEDSGAYEFKTQVEQTTYPAPSLANVGATSVTDRFSLDGDIDRPEETMTLTLFPNGNRTPNNGLALHIDGETAYGLKPDGQWEALEENPGDIFAPGGDPLGYLAAAKNIRFLDTQADGLNFEHRQYAFDFDGEAFADFVRLQMEQQMQERGSLPQGMHLSAPDVYHNTSGDGHIWLDEAGLPSRMSATLNLPPEANGEKISVVIQTDFYSFDHERIAIAQASPLTNGYTWATSTIFLPENLHTLQTTGIQLSIAVVFASLFLILISSSLKHKREFVVALNLSLIIAMLFTPLLQSQQASAFHEERVAESTANAAQTAEQERVEAATAAQKEEETWNPQQNPLVQNEQEDLQDQVASINFNNSSIEAVSAPAQQNDDPDFDTTDTDGDGLIDAIEIWIDSDINDVDTDGDGLTDGTEYHTLGTDAVAEDSDGDSIPDLKEVEGFFHNGQQWYLNPLKGDSNGDGLTDGQECEPYSLLVENGTGDCGDHDNDGTPDVFDFDNDNDGVPDKIDISPNQFLGDSGNFFDEENPFAFSIDNLTADEPTLVQFQLRPVDENQLYYSNSILDWPTFDLEGQIQRRDDTTWANTPNQAIRINAANASNGDVIVTPKLEIFVPHDSTYYANLPTLDTITDTVNIAGWLDTTKLDPFGISVRQINDDGDLNIYVPLNSVVNEESGEIVALSAQTLYWPTATGWGADHDVRLVWMVQTIVNDFYDSTDESRVIHIYKDESWTITGLNVREDHGFDIALIAEDPDVDPDLEQDDDILNLASNLSLSFTEGIDCVQGTDPDDDCTISDERMTLVDIYDRFNHTTNGSATDGERWFMSDTFVVDPHSYDHMGYVAQVAMTDTIEFLGNVYDNHTDMNPVVLFAREETSKNANMDLLEGSLNPDNAFVLDMADRELIMTASLQAAAFRYVTDQSDPNPNSNWQSYPLEEYLVYLGEKLADHPDFLPDDPNDQESLDIAEGKIMVAQIYLMSLNAGVVNIVEVDNEPWLAVEEYYNEKAYLPHSTTSWASLAGSLLYEAAYYSWWKVMPGAASSGSIVKATSTAWYKAWPKAVQAKMMKFYGYVKTAGGNIKQGDGNLKWIGNVPVSRLGKGAISVVLVAVLVITVWALVTNLTNSGGMANVETVAIIMSGLSAAVTAVLIINIINQAVRAVQLASTQMILGYATTMGVIRQVTSSARSGSVVGVIMSVLFTWGILLYYLIEGNINKYGKRALIAYGVAATILAILLFLISIIPGIGIFIVLLITLFDAVAFIICAALDSDKPICKGITGLFTEALAELFYSAEALVDLGDPSRVNLNIKGPTLSDPELGFTVDNAVTYTATVGVFLGPYNFTTNWYEGFENTPDGEFAEKSSFSYILQQGEIDHHSELGWNDVDWIKDVIEQGTIGDDEYGYLRASFAPDPLTIDFAESGTGINVPLGNVYLSESYRVPIKECSLDRCWADEKEDGTVHINIGSLLYFDIIPSTLDEFMAVTEKDDGYAQAWGQTDTGSGPYELTFPRLKDADNDGLRHVLDGGSDPNDNDWDTDDDGLSDFREHAIGTNPEDADTDNDSLTDYEEVRHGSNPLKADEDEDGLGDAIEVEGWLIGYLGIDGNVYQTRVWSDPSIADIDNDGFLDVVEFTYGLNPNSADDSDVVNNALIFDGLRVDEVGTPLLLLPFDETGGPAFNDESGNANVAICKSEDCPTAYVTGRYGPGIQFDGSSEFLTVDDIDLANKSFTVSAWAKRDGNGRNEYIFSQGTTSTNRGLHIGFRGNDSFTCAFYSNDLNTSSTYTDSDWHHWACTYDANDNLRTIYRDGVQVAQDNASANYQGSGLFNIGRRGLNSNKMSFGGSVDEVVVYDRALAVDEVANLQYGRYHLNDLIVSPDTNLTYQVTAENSLLGRTASGHFYTEPESELSPLIVSDELQSFTLEALESVTLSGSVDVDGSASNGVYPLNLTAEGAVNATESALFLSLPDPEMGIYFETNQFGNTPNDDVPLSLGNVIEATCPPPTRYGSQSCPTFVDGLNGRGLEVNGTDEAVLIESTSNNSELDLIDGDFTMGAWVYPTHDETDTTNRAVLGYYDPDQLWFDFRDNDGNTAFYDEAGVFSATCSGSACPTSDVHNNRFDGVDDRLSIANTSNLNLQTVEHMSLIMDFSIPRQIPEGQGGSIIDNMVLYEQGGGTAGLNIYADSHGGLGSQMHVCAWDLGGNPYSYGPDCVDFVVSPGTGRRLIVTFDGGNPLAGFGNSGNMKVYLDGELQGSADVYDIRSHSNGIGIGGVNGDTRLQTGTINGGANFEGTMTTLAFFPTTFNEDEVQFYNDNHFGEVFPTLFVSGTNVGMAFEDDDGTRIYNETPPGYFGLQPNKWSHVAMTYDAFNEQVTLYHNGIQIDSESIQLTTPALDKQQFRLGWAGGPFDNFEGSIDSVVFYDEVLTGDEIADVASFIFNENASLHYEFDEVPGSSEFQYGYDESEFGTCSGSSCPTSGLRGQINWATSFDGDDYIEGNLPNSTDTMLDHFSISTWIQASGVGTIFEYNHSSNNHRILLRTDRFVVDNGSRIDANFGGSGGVTNSEWHHLVATFDSADSARIYLNGVEFASKAMNGNPIEIEALGAIRIGKGLRINDEFALNGSLDDLRFYETTLTSNQVTDLYERTAPVVHFRFDEDELATQVFDASPNEFIGEVRNAQPGVEGRLGNAVRFTHDGEIVNNSQVLIQEITELGGVSSNFTIMTWIKSDDFRDSGPDTIMSWEHSALRINHSTDTKNFQLHGSDVPTGEHPQNLGEWEHLAISADSNGNLRYYLNGVLIQTATFGQDSFIDELSLGEEAGDPAGGVKDSTLDEFAFYNRALSSLEIADQYRIDSRWYRSVGTFRITVDTDAPTVELRSYTPYWQNQSTVLDVMTSDGTTAVTLVDMGIRLLGPTTELAWQGAPACEDAELGVAWCPTFDPTQLDGEGIYELVFRAVDAAGNETTSSSYFFLVDDTGPEISGNNSGTFGSPVRINYNEWYIPLDGTGSDPKIGTSGGSGLKTDSVMVALYEEDGDMAGAGLQTATVVDGNWSVDYLFNGRRPNGQYSIEVSAMDELGNITVATLGTLHIDGHSSRIDLYAEAGENENIPPDTQAPPAVDIANSGIGVVPSELLTAVHTLNGTVSDLPELAGARLNLHFEEVAGTDVYLDSSGWEHTATCTNCPTATSGFFGQALDFDGTNNVVNIAGTNSLNIGPELTLSAWVNPDVVPTTGIANLVSLGADKAVIRIDNGDLHFYMNLDGALHHIRVGGVLITDQYQHVAGTYNGQTLRLYHNGILVGSVEATGEVDDSSSVMINSSSDSFDGQMDEIMIFDRALFEHEVYNLAQSTL